MDYVSYKWLYKNIDALNCWVNELPPPAASGSTGTPFFAKRQWPATVKAKEMDGELGPIGRPAYLPAQKKSGQCPTLLSIFLAGVVSKAAVSKLSCQQE